MAMFGPTVNKTSKPQGLRFWYVYKLAGVGADVLPAV